MHADRSSGVILLGPTNPAMWGETNFNQHLTFPWLLLKTTPTPKYLHLHYSRGSKTMTGLPPSSGTTLDGVPMSSICVSPAATAHTNGSSGLPDTLI